MEATLSSYLPPKFGIIFDGWSHKSEHCVGVLAVFEHDNKAEKVLIAMAPPVQEGDENPSHTSAKHTIFLFIVPEDVQRDLTSILFLVGDNCSVNGALADRLGVLSSAARATP